MASSLSLQEVRDKQLLEVVWVSQTDHFIQPQDANKNIMVEGRAVLFGSRCNAFPYEISLVTQFWQITSRLLTSIRDSLLCSVLAGYQM